MATRLMTAEELLRLPEDHQRHELVYGVLTTMPPNSAAHGSTAATLAFYLGQYVEYNKLGVTLAGSGYILRRNPDTVRAADISFISREREALVDDFTGYPTLAPDLAVDILDPWDQLMDVMRRMSDWLLAGTRMVLLIDPHWRSVVVHTLDIEGHRLTEDDWLDGADVVHGWTMPIRALFE
jgi:Uma2 family endonuclease